MRDKILEAAIKKHQGLVRHCINPFIKKFPLEDREELLHLGNIGLFKALTRFDLEKGTKISTFAAPYLRGEVQHYLRDKYKLRHPEKLILEEFDEENFIVEEFNFDNSEVLAAISWLSPRQKQIITLIHIDGFSADDAAAQLKITKNGLLSQKTLAYKNLKRIINGEPVPKRRGRPKKLEPPLVKEEPKSKATRHRDAKTFEITPQEEKVIQLICQGLTNKEIAQELTLGQRTIESHVNSILSKTYLTNRAQIVVKFYPDYYLKDYKAAIEAELQAAFEEKINPLLKREKEREEFEARRRRIQKEIKEIKGLIKKLNEKFALLEELNY